MELMYEDGCYLSLGIQILSPCVVAFLLAYAEDCVFDEMGGKELR